VPGALAGGSSYVNLLDGDASTVAFTVATRERMSLYRRLGGGRMATLIVLHPVRVMRMAAQSLSEWLREELERVVAGLSGRVTHSEGMFPYVRILSNVIVRELQTIAIMLDVYLGVPVIYSTFMQYDELAHHFGPSSRMALADLRRTDARIAEIWRMIRAVSSRRYDLVLLSDHGMTPATSYRVRFGETLGITVRRLLDAYAERAGEVAPELLASASEDSEYADVGPAIVEALAQASGGPDSRRRRTLRRIRDWVRSHYGLREIVVPEKYSVDTRREMVVTYSSCLALVYFADVPRPLELAEIRREPRRAALYAGLLAHDGIGLIATRDADAVHLESRLGHAVIERDTLRVLSGSNPLDEYGADRLAVRAIREMVQQTNAGDMVLFGAYDGYDIVSFDDQVGAHGCVGGEQAHPFLMTPPSLDVRGEPLEDARDIHRVVLARYALPVSLVGGERSAQAAD
jgi:hypothetical protein